MQSACRHVHRFSRPGPRLNPVCTDGPLLLAGGTGRPQRHGQPPTAASETRTTTFLHRQGTATNQPYELVPTGAVPMPHASTAGSALHTQPARSPRLSSPPGRQAVRRHPRPGRGVPLRGGWSAGVRKSDRSGSLSGLQQRPGYPPPEHPRARDIGRALAEPAVVVVPGSAAVEMLAAAVVADRLCAGFVGAVCCGDWVRRHVGAPVPIVSRSARLAPMTAAGVIASAQSAFGTRHATTRPSGPTGSLGARHVHVVQRHPLSP